MNILMLTNTFTPHVGGVARSVQSFMQEYRRLGHRVIVIAPQFEGAPEHEDDIIRVPAIQNFYGSDFSVPMPIPGLLSSALEQFKPDIVHSHHPFLLGDTALRIAATKNVPVIFTHHTQYDRYLHYVSNSSPALQRFVKDLVTGYCNLCDAVIAPSESIATVLLNQGVTTPIEVIPTGIDIAQFSQGNGAGFRATHNIPTDAFVIGHTGRLAPEKNLAFLAEAVAEFLTKNPSGCFVVIGTGPSSEAIEQLFRQRGLFDRLYLTGSLQGQSLVDAYQAMDTFAFASQSETQGLVLTEAMAAGVPVVAVDASGVREVVIDKYNGRLLPDEDLREFAAALTWIATLSRTERAQLNKAAQDTAEAFSISRCAAHALKLYQSLSGREHTAKNSGDNLWSTTLRLIEEEWKIIGTKAKAAGAALLKSGPADHQNTGTTG